MTVIRKTRSVCPVCLAPIAAHLAEENGAVYMEKTCRLHGYFKTLVWRGLSDFADWRENAAPLKEGEGEKCPDCRRCGSHTQGTCCVLLEVTPRCDLNCAFCFAPKKGPEPSLDELKGAVDIILSHGRPLIQLSGGEP
ncbi:MAG: radical SAM protein, partial [Oscillospiraceae bacterium]|nr:radical SAM protein [Oscillospiraceae bacterium]